MTQNTPSIFETGQQNGSVYLCQVNDTVSCGACCGLYNVGHLSQTVLEKMLIERATLFETVPRTIAGIDDFRERIDGWTKPKRPFAQFHHCPFLGLVTPDYQRVGCLLHPKAAGNDGIDFRGLSYYGGFACRTYFCPSSTSLPTRYLAILRQAFDHWYPFGLIVTERKLLQAVFSGLEKRINREVTPDDFLLSSEPAALLREFAALKITWQYRPENAPGPCHYMFENGEYIRTPAYRATPDIPASDYDPIFVEFESAFHNKKELHNAEDILETLFSKMGTAISKTK